MTQRIKTQVPKGFAIVVEESFQSLDGNQIFVFEHIASKKKLYCRLCSISDLKKGYIWEVLTPEALKELKIEESVNSEYYESKPYTVEESAGEDDEQERIRKETEEFMRKQKEKNSQVVINLVGKGSEGEGKSKEELETELEDYKNKLTIIAHREFERKKHTLGAPDWIKSPSDLKDWEENHGNIDPTTRRSSGTLTLEGQTSTGAGMAFADQAEMIQYLQRKIHSPRSSPEEKREAQAVKDELWRKFLSGKKGKARNEGFDPIRDEGTPLFTKFYEEWKKREKGED